MLLKASHHTLIKTDDKGYLHIHQDENSIALSYPQVQRLLDFLKDGNGLKLESEWDQENIKTVKLG